MKNLTKIITILLVFSMALSLMNLKSNNSELHKSSFERIRKNVSKLYEIQAVKIPKNNYFAGEEIPIQKDDIKERLDRELLVNTYWQSNTLLLIKRANKWLPIIEPILAKEGLPDDFKYLAIAESGLQNVRSYSGACGFWQFMKGTGKDFGLEINKNIDERYNLDKVTRAAIKYIKKSKKKFGSWILAAAAYNAGNSKIAKRLSQQKVTNYFDLLLNSETQRYVFRILALKEILTNPKKYGFIFDKEDLYTYPKTKKMTINFEIPDLANFAKKHKTTYKELKLLNPWLRQRKLDNKKNKEYILTIPVK